MKDLIQLYAGDITKSTRDDNGDLIVIGTAATTSIDIDQQIADPEWLKTAMPQWMKWGNVREQHSKIAAGVGMELEEDGDSWHLKSAIVDASTASKVERRVLKGYSIGIKGPQIVKDAAAPGGRIVGGEIVEISLVDRPANPDCIVGIAKAAGEGVGDKLQPVDAEPDTLKAAFGTVEGLTSEQIDTLVDLAKKDYTTAQRKQLAKDGKAMPGGGFPINNAKDLHDAILDIGRAKDEAKAKAHIKAMAAKLGDSAMIPDTWKSAWADLTKANDDEWTHDPAQLQAVRDGIAQLMQAELDELMKGEPESWDLSDLLCTLQTFLSWWQHEAAEGEVPVPGPDDGEDDMDFVTLGVDPDVVKAAEADDATDEAKAALKEGLLKALGVDPAIATPEAFKTAVGEATKGLRDEVAELRGMAAPGGPVTTRTGAQGAKAAEADNLRNEADRYRQLAATVDHETAQGYRQKAAECEDRASRLAAPETAA